MSIKIVSNGFKLILGLAALATGSQVWAERSSTVMLKPISAGYQVDLSTQPLPTSLMFPVVGGSQLTITVLSGENDLTLKLQLPDGTLVEQQNAVSYGGHFEAYSPQTPFEKVYVSPVDMQLITLSNPPAGLYELHIYGMAATASEEIPVIVKTVGSRLRTGFIMGSSRVEMLLGQPISFSVFLFEQSTPIAGAVVRGKVLNTDRVEVASLVFSDNGQRGDRQAGDGLYSVLYEPQQTGGYLISVNIQGTTSTGLPFEAKEGGRLVVNTPDIQLTGTFRDQGFDEDNDGYFDSVRFEFDAEGPRGDEGTYYIDISVEAGNGKTTYAIGRVSDPAAPLTVDMPAERLKKLGMDGPYRLVRVHIEHDNRSLGLLKNLGETAAYRLSSLERRNTLVYPLSADRGVDVDGDELFDRLEVVFGVDVLISGYYGISADLNDQNKTDLDAVYIGDLYLERGYHDVTLGFSGERIGLSGQDGPYILNNVLVYPRFDAEASTSFYTAFQPLGTTQAYTCSQFAGCGNDDPYVLLERLISQVEALNLKKGFKNSLRAKLISIRAVLSKNNKGAEKVAIKKISAFIHEVRAQREKTLSQPEADMLIEGGSVLVLLWCKSQGDPKWRRCRYYAAPDQIDLTFP